MRKSHKNLPKHISSRLGWKTDEGPQSIRTQRRLCDTNEKSWVQHWVERKNWAEQRGSNYLLTVNNRKITHTHTSQKIHMEYSIIKNFLHSTHFSSCLTRVLISYRTQITQTSALRGKETIQRFPRLWIIICRQRLSHGSLGIAAHKTAYLICGLIPSSQSMVSSRNLML